MNKVVIKSALITVLALVIAGLAVFAVWLLGFPQSMATVCEKTGNYSFAVTCSSLKYGYTKDVGDLARCAEDGIMSGKDKYILRYGEELISHEKFDSLCVSKDAAAKDNPYGAYATGYKYYVCGNVAAAEYRAGELGIAIQTASIAGAQAFVKLVIAVAESGNATDAQTVLDALGAIEARDSVEAEYLENLKKILNEYI